MGSVLWLGGTVARDRTAARVSGSEKETQALITMLVERDYRGIG
jgi:hypothetical protein